MIDPGKFLQHLKSNGIDFFAGVPDSLMKELLVYVDQSDLHHYITANEGLAVGLASGYHFATGKVPLVYLQNSGLGNIINPITSLADKDVYSIPMLLLIGWRGQPGIPDEPQHIRMGKITTSMLDVLGIPYYELSKSPEEAERVLAASITRARELSQPVALLVLTGTFERISTAPANNSYSLEREQVIRAIYEKLKDDDVVVCTTGKTGREFDTCNRQHQYRIKQYFLSVGAMGHANHIAAGICMFRSNCRTIMLDGDGALLMQMGSMPAIAQWTNNNFIHILLNNESHESVGGQATLAKQLDMAEIAKACGYAHVRKIATGAGLENLFEGLEKSQGPVFIEVLVNTKSRPDLERPTLTPAEAKQTLMKALASNQKPT